MSYKHIRIKGYGRSFLPVLWYEKKCDTPLLLNIHTNLHYLLLLPLSGPCLLFANFCLRLASSYLLSKDKDSSLKLLVWYSTHIFITLFMMKWHTEEEYGKGGTFWCFSFRRTRKKTFLDRHDQQKRSQYSCLLIKLYISQNWTTINYINIGVVRTYLTKGAQKKKK